MSPSRGPDLVVVFLERSLYSAPLTLLGAIALVVLALAMWAGIALRGRHDRRWPLGAAEEPQEAYFVGAVFGLLALLMGFTFSLAVDRFDTRRALVLQEANAIATTYLRAQLLEEPHRARISRLLIEYTDNRLALAEASPGHAGRALLAANDRLITDLWTATAAAFPTIRGTEFSNVFLEAMNEIVRLDAARKAARLAHVPFIVFVVLFTFLVVTAGMLGYVLIGRRTRSEGALVLVLLTLSFLLVIDIDRPLGGGVREPQGPMERMRASLQAWQPAVFDRLRNEDTGSTRTNRP